MNDHKPTLPDSEAHQSVPLTGEELMAGNRSRGRDDASDSSDSYEIRRLAALERYNILDTSPEEAFEELVELAGYICDAPIAAINFVDRARQWFKAERGLGVRQTDLDVSICAHAILQRELFIVPDTLKDPRFASNPLVTGEPHLRFYVGALLETPDGYPIGTLCVLDYKPRTLSKRQIDALVTLSRQVMVQLELMRANARQEEMLAELEDAKASLAKLASTDPLTGLANRRAFDNRLTQELALVKRGASRAALMMADLDHFKRINDRFGHYVGDEALRNFADLCRDVFRTSDVIGRWGGEEFVVLLPDTNLEEAEAVARRLHDRLAQSPMAEAESPVYVTISIGIMALNPELPPQKNLQNLDDLMYGAKDQGRNCTLVGRPSS